MSNKAKWMSAGLEILGRIESAHKRAKATRAIAPNEHALHVAHKLKACSELVDWVLSIANMLD